MIFKRKIYERLKLWKEESDGRSALLIEGARRVGKTTVVKEFVKNEYDDSLIIDFSKVGPNIKALFEGGFNNMDAFFRDLFLYTGHELEGDNCIIVFDEVQFCPLARQAIKHLVEDGRYHYIETGSLISIKKNVEGILIPSEEERIQMYPMDFEEFLWATNDNITMKIIKEAFEGKTVIDDKMHREINNRFHIYMAVGGMPQAVLEYVNGRTYSQIDKAKRMILDLYEADLRKDDKKASAIFKTIPEQLAHKNSNFRFSKVNKNARYQNYLDAIDYIGDSMIGNLCLNVTEPDTALDLFVEPSNFKLYMGDTGLLITQILRRNESLSNELYKDIISGHTRTNLGMIFENIAAQILRASGYGLYFHEFEYENSKYEIDFLTVKGRRLVPIEVKSSTYKTHKSFDNFKTKYQLKLLNRYIVYDGIYQKIDDITYLPLYMLMLV